MYVTGLKTSVWYYIYTHELAQFNHVTQTRIHTHTHTHTHVKFDCVTTIQTEKRHHWRCDKSARSESRNDR
jgi:hypothetical protein